MLELNGAPSVGGVEINTSKCGPLNWEHLCPSAPQLQGLFRVAGLLSEEQVHYSSRFSLLWHAFMMSLLFICLQFNNYILSWHLFRLSRWK